MIDQPPTSRGDHAKAEAFAFLELLAVTWLAVAQPLLDTFQRGAETFVFRRASASDIVALAIVITFGPAVILYLVELAVGLVDRHARTWVHRGFLSIAVALFAVEIAVRELSLQPVSYWLLGAGVSVLVLVFLVRFRAVQVFLRFLSIAPFVLAALFVLTPPVSQVAFADGALTADGVELDDPPPIVMVVFDELPTASLLDGDDRIDEQLFPNFARFAADSTWYPNYSSVSPTTPEAVPALLTGQYPDEIDQLPTSGAHPDNLFTLLSGAYEMNVWEQATQLCPPETCPAAGEVDGTGLAALLDDARSVWSDLLTVRPEGTDDQPFKVRQSDPSAPDRFDDFIASLDDTTVPRLDFLHVLLPHQPWRHLPSGKRHNAEFLAEGLDQSYQWRTDFFAQAARQRHLLQLQRTDAALGDLLDRLDELDRYDESLIILTADHGVSFTEGEPIRGVSEGNQEQTMWTPLLVKAPGQEDGRITPAPVESVDLLPTIAAEIGVDLPFEIDGAAIDESSEAPSGGDLRRIYRWKGFSDIELFPGEDYALVDGTEAWQELLDHDPWPVSDDPTLRLYSFGRHGTLVGRSVTDLDVGSVAAFTGEVDDPDETLKSDEVSLDFDDVDLDGPVVPAYVRGTIDSTEPVDLVIAVNGKVAGWCPSFVDTKQADDTQSFFTMVPEQLLVDGANEIAVYAVDTRSDDTRSDDTRLANSVVLHPIERR